MHMALPVAARAHGARSWSSSSGALPGHIAAAATVRFGRTSNGGNRRAVLCLASGGGGGRGPWEPADSPWDGRLVDEGMATLRRRIREARAGALPASGPDEDDEEESGVDGDGLPAEWTELERRHHGSYVAGVRGAVGVLQALLLRTRPGLGAGVVALVLLSVPASVLIVSSRLIEAVDSISSAVLKR